MSIILASQSPRRKELLARITPDFQAIPADIDERVDPQLTPKEYVLAMARKKAELIYQQNRESLVIGSDTIVVLNNEILGKPQDESAAFKMLSALSGSTHVVYTSLCLISHDRIEEKIVAAEVTFFELTEAEIKAYIASGDPFDKAGAYGIQGQAAFFVESIKGDYYAIVGFPIAQVKRMLAKFK